jgi:hypothetical protein
MHGADAPGWAHWLEATLLAEWMRGSPWAYPAASVLHVLGLGLLLGSILAFDLRILVVDDGILSRPMGRLLLNLARTGFAIAGLSGLPMLAADATHVAVNPAFQMKLALLAVSLVNILVFHQFALPARGAARPGRTARVCATISLVGWPAVIVCGRMIAYF